MAAAWIDIALLSSTLISWLAVVLALLCIGRLRRQARLTRELYDQLQRELKLANSGAMGMGRRLLGLERQFKSALHSRQFEQPDETPLSYSRALNLFDTGVGADEVARTCGLSQAEASLMKVMHRHMNSGGRHAPELA